MAHFISNETFYKITEALRLKKRLEAVKLYKLATNCSLLDAKLVIDNWEREKPLIAEKDYASREQATAASLDKIYLYLIEGQKMEAFRYVCAVYELEADEAYAYLENLERGKMSVSEFREKRNCVSESEIRGKIVDLLKKNEKLAAVKELRSALNYSLLEAISYLEERKVEIAEGAYAEESPPISEEKDKNFANDTSSENEDNSERIIQMIAWGGVSLILYVVWKFIF